MKKALFVYPYSNLSTNPTMCLLINSLIESGWQVDLIDDDAHANEFPKFSFGGNRLRQLGFNDRLWWQPAGAGLARNAWRIVNKPFRIDPAWFKRWMAKRYDCIFGVDPIGIATAAQLNSIAKVPLVYISFEILLADEAEASEETQLKIAEKAAARGSDLILIQDSDRAAMLANDNELPLEKFCLVPVAPAGDLPSQTDYLRDQLGVPNEQTIILFQGTIASWSGRDEWESLLSCWGDTIALVVHSRRQIGARHRKFLDRLASQYPVYVTDQPVGSDELAALIGSADIGLVSYFPNPDQWHTFGNLDPLGLASGKLAAFLMCGVPVLANHRTSVGHLVREQKLGATYDSVESSVNCIHRIMNDRAAISASARMFYEQKLDPTQPIAEFIDRVERL